MMALISAFTSYRNTHAQKYRLLVIGSSDVDVISLSCVSLAVIGLFNVSFGVFKMARKCTMSRNQVRISKLLFNNYFLEQYFMK